MKQFKDLLKFQQLKISVIIASVLIISFYFQSLGSDTIVVNAKISESNQSSFQPNVFHSGSGRLHLLFQHEVTIGDVILNKYYHAYEFGNGSWSQPKQLESPYTAFTQPLLHIDPNNDGFTLYYFVNHEGLYKWTYQEQEDNWQEPVLLFGKSEANDLLQTGKNIVLHFHAFYSSGNDEFYITWSFEALDSIHDNEQLYIMSRIFPNGSIYSQTLKGSLMSYSQISKFTFIQTNKNFSLFRGLDERTLLLSNNTWSNLQPLSLVEQSLFNFSQLMLDIPSTTYEILDFFNFLSQNPIENLSSTIFTPPFTPHFLTDFVFNLSSVTDPFITCAAITTQGIEFWRFGFLEHQWSLIGKLNYSVTDLYDYTLDLVINDKGFHFFWSEEVEFALYEIYTISFDPLTKTWSNVTQITNATVFTDDYIINHSTPMFFLSPLIGFAVFSFLKRKVGRKRKGN